MPVNQPSARPNAIPHRRRALPRRLLSGLAVGTLFALSTASALASGPMTYQVQPGDTLFHIAGQFGVSPDQIVATSGLGDPNALKIGQTLTIPDDSGAVATMPSVALPSAPTFPPDAAPSILVAPYYSQFDGSAYGQSNCGPTSLAMALGALGVSADQMSLRHWADVQMGTNSPDSGTSWEALAYAARHEGAQVQGLYGSSGYHQWTMDGLVAELNQGHPVLLLVRYWDLPGHGSSGFPGDHYIVAIGVDGSGNIVYNDPATYSSDAGSELAISPSRLKTAWSDTWVGLVRTAMALSN